MIYPDFLESGWAFLASYVLGNVAYFVWMAGNRAVAIGLAVLSWAVLSAFMHLNFGHWAAVFFSLPFVGIIAYLRGWQFSGLMLSGIFALVVGFFALWALVGLIAIICCYGP